MTELSLKKSPYSHHTKVNYSYIIYEDDLPLGRRTKEMFKVLELNLKGYGIYGDIASRKFNKSLW